MASANLVQLIKQIAVDAVNAGKPCDYRTGIVTQENPLHIKISNSLVLEEDFLHLARNVTDYEVEIILDGGKGLDDAQGWRSGVCRDR